MSLIGALHVGRTGLAVSQAALEVTGNNLANAATEGYTRQTANVAAGAGVQVAPGMFIGTGVRLKSIIRHVDEALNSRTRFAIADEHAARQQQDILSQIESIENELTDQGLSSRLDSFFTSWSQLAGNPADSGLRSLVVSGGASLADFIQDMRGDFVSLRQQIDESIRTNVDHVNGLLEQVTRLNREITVAEAGLGGGNDLRDQRDKLLGEISQYLDISTIEQASGAVDVFVGSIPVILGTMNRGVEAKFESEGESLVVKLRVKADGSPLAPEGGKLGQLLASRETDVNAALETLDTFAAQLIFTINRVHSSGQGVKGYTSLTADNVVLDPTAALNNEVAGLPFTPVNGSFQVTVKQKSTGTTTTTQIQVDLDGIGADTSLNDLAAAFTAAGLTASISTDGRLSLATASNDFEMTFANDSSGVLAALGLNSFFTGVGAGSIGMSTRLTGDPSYLSTTQNNVVGGNAGALAMAQAGSAVVDALGGLSLRDYWRRHVEDYAVRGSQAKQNVDAAESVVQALQTQRQSVSGVNMDEETINLLAFQRAYQGSARFISVIDEMMQTLLGLVQ